MTRTVSNDPESKLEHRSAAGPIPSAPFSNRKGTVCVIEDNPSLSNAMSFRLRHAGYRVIQSFDGIDGLGSIVRARPDLILLDLGLPSLNGFEILRRLEMVQDPRSPAQVAVVTGDDSEEVVRELEAFGVTTVIHKPFGHKSLLRSVRKLIRTEV